MADILVLHGALGSAHQFSETGDPRPETGDQRPETVIEVMEFFGHGAAPDVDEAWTIDTFVDQLEGYLDPNSPHRQQLVRLGAPLSALRSPLSVFGFSMGGYVALSLAKRRPDLISRVLTLGTKLSWSPEQASHEIRMLDPDIIEQKVPKFAADLQHRHGHDHWRTVMWKTAELMKDLGDAPRLTPETMDQCTVPVRYLIGDRDEMVTLDETVNFYRATPNAELAVLPATRHPIEKVRKDLIDWHIADFLL